MAIKAEKFALHDIPVGFRIQVERTGADSTARQGVSDDAVSVSENIGAFAGFGWPGSDGLARKRVKAVSEMAEAPPFPAGLLTEVSELIEQLFSQ